MQERIIRHDRRLFKTKERLEAFEAALKANTIRTRAFLNELDSYPLPGRSRNIVARFFRHNQIETPTDMSYIPDEMILSEAYSSQKTLERIRANFPNKITAE